MTNIPTKLESSNGRVINKIIISPINVTFLGVVLRLLLYIDDYDQDIFLFNTEPL